MNIHQLTHSDDRPATSASASSSHLTPTHASNATSPFGFSSSRSPSPNPLSVPSSRGFLRTPSTASLRSAFTSATTVSGGDSSSSATKEAKDKEKEKDKEGKMPPDNRTGTSKDASSSSSRARLMRLPLLQKLAARTSGSSQRSGHARRRSSLTGPPETPQLQLPDVPASSHSDPDGFTNFYANDREGSTYTGSGSGSGSYAPSTRTVDTEVPSHSDQATIHGDNGNDEGFSDTVEPGQPAQYEFYEDTEAYHQEAYNDVEMVSAASTSIRQGSHAYVYENGRRYHWFKEGTYNFPNDAEEQEAEEMRHGLVGQLFEGHLHFAPIVETPQRILDLGTGTGQWAIEMADTYPSAMVKGVDLSPIQPNWVPPNVRFMVDDIEGGWFYSNLFDLIHARHAALAIRNWPRLLENSYNHLAPGGWVELHELDYMPYSIDPNLDITSTPVHQYWHFVRQGLQNLGVSVHMVADGHLANALETAGFTNVTERIFHVPIGGWAGADGVLWQSLFVESVQATALGPLTRGLGWTREQVELFLVDVRRGYQEEGLRLGMTMHVVYGQRPDGAGQKCA